MEKQELINEIKRLKKESKILLVAHYYVDSEIQELADYVGDSYYLSKVCRERAEQLIVFCGVRFMGESAKILNPEKKIMMAETIADCPMAHMISVEKIKRIKSEYKDLATVCYINSTAEVKAYADVVVTSSNAHQIVSKLPQKHILFIPDRNLGSYIAKQFPEKHFILNEGFCPVHVGITREELEAVIDKYPQAKVLVHPECQEDVIALADYVGSTSGIIHYATESNCEQFIICTEQGIFYELRKRNPQKQFYAVVSKQICHNMKRVTLQQVYETLKNQSHSIEVDENIAGKAKHALSRMHELGS